MANSSLWDGDTHYILTFGVNSNINLDLGSILGGDNFNGQIAEILIFSTDPGTSNQTYIRTELNKIHGVY